MTCFEKDTLLTGIAGGMSIVGAISAMNNLQPATNAKLVGISLFTAGWFIIISQFRKTETRDEKHKNTLTISALSVWMSAMAHRMMVEMKFPNMQIAISTLVFFISWIVLGKTVGTKSYEDENGETIETTSFIGLLTPFMVFVSMGLVNKIERPQKIASGMGLAIFTLAWVVLALVNSRKEDGKVKEE